MTRLRMRRAATDVFARQGFEATRVSDIVQEAGVTQPTFYIHFPSKEAAYEALIADFREKLRLTTLANLIDTAETPAARIDRVAVSFRRFLDLMADDRALTEIGLFQPPSCTVTKQRMVGWVAANIVQEQSRAVFRPDIPADDIARLLVGMLEQFGRVEADDQGRQRIAETCARLFCNGTATVP